MTKARDLASNSTGSKPTLVDAKGDLLVGTAADTTDRLAAGSNNTVLTADSTTATGLKWAAPSSALTLSQIATGSLTSGTQLNLTGLSNYDTIMLQIYNVGWATGDDSIQIRVNSNTGSVYSGVYNWIETISGNENLSWSRDNDATRITLNRANSVGRTDQLNSLNIKFTNCKSAGFTTWEYILGFRFPTSSTEIDQGQGIITSAAAISSIQFSTNNGYTFNAGSYTVWGG